MSVWIQQKYINQVSASLRNFKQKGADAYNFSCPFCGDSKTDSRKARAFLHSVSDPKTFQRTYVFFCHNVCGGKSFSTFLEQVNPGLFHEYKIENFRERSTSEKPAAKQQQITAEQFVTKVPVVTPTSKLIKTSTLPETHPAVQYLRRRCVKALDRFYYTDNFFEAVQELSPTQKISVKAEPRVCMLLQYPNKDIFGIVGRQLNSEGDQMFRYITLKFDKDAPKLYGLDNLNKTRPTFLVEGPIDSTYLPNAVALCGSMIIFESLNHWINKENTIVVLDNEPRHIDTLRNMKRFISAGYKVVIWEDMPTTYKDISDMICSGMTVRDVLKFIAEHNYNGLAAEYHFNLWKKIDETRRA